MQSIPRNVKELRRDPNAITKFRAADAPLSDSELERRHREFKAYFDNDVPLTTPELRDLSNLQEMHPDDVSRLVDDVTKEIISTTTPEVKISKVTSTGFDHVTGELDGQEAITNMLTTMLSDLPTMNHKRLFSNMVHRGSGKYGSVYTSSLGSTTKPNVAIKVSDHEDTVHEAAIGYCMINYVNKTCPNFIQTYAHSKCTDKSCMDKADYINTIYMEIANGQMLHNMYMTEDETIQVLTQILLALECAYSLFRFTHYDLHPGNIIARRLSKPVQLKYIMGDVIVTYTTTMHVKIIDYGLSYCKYGEHNVMGTPIPWFGIVATSNPTYDVQRLFQAMPDYDWVNRIVNMIREFNPESINFQHIRSEDYLDWLGTLIAETGITPAITVKVRKNITNENVKHRPVEHLIKRMTYKTPMLFNKESAQLLDDPDTYLLKKYKVDHVILINIIYHLGVYFMSTTPDWLKEQVRAHLNELMGDEGQQYLKYTEARAAGKPSTFVILLKAYLE